MSDVARVIKLLKEVLLGKRINIGLEHDVPSWNHGYQAGYNDAVWYVLEFVYDDLGYDDDDLEDD